MFSIKLMFCAYGIKISSMLLSAAASGYQLTTCSVALFSRPTFLFACLQILLTRYFIVINAPSPLIATVTTTSSQ